MNEKEQNFGDLKKLLKLKQHEVPPPGYFNNFSGNVIARIRAGEASASQNLTERLQSAAPWLASLLRIFETKPGLVGGFATSLCLLLVMTVVFAERSEQVTGNFLAVSPETATTTATGDSLAAAPAPILTASALATADNSGGIMISSNPVTSLQPTTTMFGQPAYASLFQPASFAPAH